MRGLTFLAALIVASAPFAASAADQQPDRPALAQASAPAHAKVLRLSDALMDQISAGDAPGILGGGIGTAALQGNLNLTKPLTGIIQSTANAGGNPPGILPLLGNCTAGKCF